MRCAARGITVWVAGGAAARVEEAQAVGAALNVWDADPALVASRAKGPDAVEVTWAGPAPAKGGASLETRILELARAGATWAVFGWPIDPVALVAAAREAGEAGWWRREAIVGTEAVVVVHRAGGRVVDSHDGVPPDQWVAPVRLRHHQQPEGRSPASRP